ncbi:GrpB family protein [Gracilibacillus xinjiangensis]|uniref:GrpB family protein n=1 Tax=Gracilibacillus xinjiangensis TaxID=1193282 RepID=A0ABV8WXX2_9BACI
MCNFKKLKDKNSLKINVLVGSGQMLGLNKGEVKLVEHSADWKKLFHKEKELLNGVIGEYVLDIQHIGSTAVDGLEAKPVIDMAVGLEKIGGYWKY